MARRRSRSSSNAPGRASKPFLMPNFLPTRVLMTATAVMSVVLAACGGPSRSFKMALNAQLAQQNYAAAEALLERNKALEYGKKNMVLYYLDQGTILHHEGKYKESDASFDRAEQRMEELYTKSVTKTAGMLALNDTTVDYAGEPFERALTNVYRALNYVFLGMPDEALVESRKVEIFLEELNSQLEQKSVYKDDAFARYLDALLYADAGQMDDARISMAKATQAYSWYSSSYGTPTPRFDWAPNDAQAPQGELVFIHYNGVAPLKVSKSFQVAWGRGLAIAQASGDTEAHGAQFRNALNAGIAGRAITVAYPAYQAQPFLIRDSEVAIDGAQSSPTVLMEDIQAIAAKGLQDRMPLITSRAVARAVVKYVIAKAAADAAGRACDQQFGSGSLGDTLCRGVAGGVAHGAAAATEIADTRCWGTLPAQIRMSRIKVPAGLHMVTVNFKDAAGRIVSSHVFNGVEIKKGKRTYLNYRTAI